jgi:hypothetical protein
VGRRFETRAYFASLAVTAVMLPGAAGFTTSMLYVLHEKAGLTWWINRDGPRAFLYGSALTLVAWPLFALLFQRFGRVEGSNPTEYERLRSAYAGLRTRYETIQDDTKLGSRLAGSLLDGVALLLRIEGADPSTRGMIWASQTGYVVARANLDSTDTALLEFKSREELAGLAVDLRACVDGSRIAGSASLVETTRDMRVELARPDPDLALVRARLAQVKATIDEYRDGRRYGLTSARSSLYGAILLGGTLSYLVLGLAIVAGAGPEQIIAGIVFYLVGAVVGLFRQLAAASSADTQAAEDYGLDDARLIQRPLFSGVAAVGGVVLTTIAVALAPPATSSGSKAKPAPEVPSLEEIFDLGENKLAVVYAAFFGLTPALFARRLGAAAERFKADLQSTESSQQPGGA